MKKYLILLVLLAGCYPKEHPNSPKRGGIGDLRVWVDSETGCEYLTVGSSLDGQAVTPRMGRDGKQICRGGL